MYFKFDMNKNGANRLPIFGMCIPIIGEMSRITDTNRRVDPLEASRTHTEYSFLLMTSLVGGLMPNLIDCITPQAAFIARNVSIVDKQSRVKFRGSGNQTIREETTYSIGASEVGILDANARAWEEGADVQLGALFKVRYIAEVGAPFGEVTVSRNVLREWLAENEEALELAPGWIRPALAVAKRAHSIASSAINRTTHNLIKHAIYGLKTGKFTPFDPILNVYYDEDEQSDARVYDRLRDCIGSDVISHVRSLSAVDEAKREQQWKELHEKYAAFIKNPVEARGRVDITQPVMRQDQIVLPFDQMKTALPRVARLEKTRYWLSVLTIEELRRVALTSLDDFISMTHLRYAELSNSEGLSVPHELAMEAEVYFEKAYHSRIHMDVTMARTFYLGYRIAVYDEFLMKTEVFAHKLLGFMEEPMDVSMDIPIGAEGRFVQTARSIGGYNQRSQELGCENGLFGMSLNLRVMPTAKVKVK